MNIEVQPFSDGLKEAYERLLPEQLDSVARGTLLWRFRDNPASKGVFSTAIDDASGRIIGLNAFAPFRIKMGEQIVTGYQSMDTIIERGFRGQGLFTKLINAFYDAAPMYDAAILYGFPNGSSAHGFFSKLGWTRLGSPPFLIKPLRSGYFLKSVIGRAAQSLNAPLSFARRCQISSLVTLDVFDEHVDAIWNELARNIPCAVERNHNYLNWRIFHHPEVRYTTKAIRGEHGSVRAFITYIALKKHGGHIGYVMEAMALPGAHDDLAKLFNEMTADFLDQRVDAILGWCPSHAPNYAAYRRAGFFVLPERIRPIELHFGCKPLRQTYGRLGLKYKDWYISYLDSDTV